MIKKIVESLVTIFKLGKELPEPIYYFYMPPKPQILPEQILKKAKTENNLWAALIGIENFSDRVLEHIRIKIPSGLQYPPQIETDTKQTRLKWKFFPEENELHIEKLDPKESMYAFMFPRSNEVDEFQKPIVIVGNQLLTSGMQRHGFVRKHPGSVGLLAAIVILLIAGAVFAGYSVWEISPLNADVAIVNQALSNVERFSTCHPFVVRGPDINKARILAKSKLNEQSQFSLNGVSSWEELLKREAVVVCE
jgi:hypothetical protein